MSDKSSSLLSSSFGSRTLVAPSILSANFGKLQDEINAIQKAGADWLHIDVMDGHFVPNFSFGAVVLSSIKTTLPIDIHLMVNNASFFVEHFASFKPSHISFHIENEVHPRRVIQQIRAHKILPAIALCPSTPLVSLEYLIEELDMILLMSVEPGFGGQKMLSMILRKAEALKKLLEKRNPTCIIQMDGGINGENIHSVKNAGVDVVVAGSYVFGSSNYQEAISSLQIPH